VLFCSIFDLLKRNKKHLTNEILIVSYKLMVISSSTPFSVFLFIIVEKKNHYK
jgi:hypothetical protein